MKLDSWETSIPSNQRYKTYHSFSLSQHELRLQPVQRKWQRQLSSRNTSKCEEWRGTLFHATQNSKTSVSFKQTFLYIRHLPETPTGCPLTQRHYINRSIVWTWIEEQIENELYISILFSILQPNYKPIHSKLCLRTKSIFWWRSIWNCRWHRSAFEWNVVHEWTLLREDAFRLSWGHFLERTLPPISICLPASLRRTPFITIIIIGAFISQQWTSGIFGDDIRC